MMNTADKYIHAAVEGESAIVACAQSSTRNHVLNRAAFKLGTIPNMPTDTAIRALLLAANSNGYLKEHGESATRKVIESGLRNGQSNQRPSLRQNRDIDATAPKIIESVKSDPNPEPTTGDLPRRTAPDAQGKPSFQAWGAEGPPIRSDEKRRHVYTSGLNNNPVRMKIMRKGGGAVNWYRVRDEQERAGWQARKPEGYIEVPYAGTVPRCQVARMIY
jgi:hypothetical protein